MNKTAFFLTFLSLFAIPFSVFAACPCQNAGEASVETVVKNEASGENASVKTEITNVVNEKTTIVQATGSGELRVEVNNGQVEIQ